MNIKRSIIKRLKKIKAFFKDSTESVNTTVPSSKIKNSPYIEAIYQSLIKK